MISSDGDKTREQLISELVALRQRVAELEKLEAKQEQGEEAKWTGRKYL